MENNVMIDRIVKAMVEFNPREESMERRRWAMDINAWDWVPGVGMYGISRVWKHTGKQEYFDFIKNWVDRHMEKAYGVKTVNSTAPMSTVLQLYLDTKDEKYLKVCTNIADWVLDEAPRTREGGLEHTVTEAGANFSEQIWADTLFMVCIFLCRLGRVTGNPRYTKAAAEQLVIHHTLLKDRDSGAFFHGWNCEDANWMSSARWGRANAWITASTVEMLEELPEDFEGRELVLQSLNEQVRAFAQWQRPHGAFGTLLDKTDSYDETSATAGIAYGIKRGIKAGYLSPVYEEVWKRAMNAVLEMISTHGEVLGVSGGTPVMPTQEDYKTLQRYPALYGQSLVLLLLCEE